MKFYKDINYLSFALQEYQALTSLRRVKLIEWDKGEQQQTGHRDGN